MSELLDGWDGRAKTKRFFVKVGYSRELDEYWIFGLGGGSGQSNRSASPIGAMTTTQLAWAKTAEAYRVLMAEVCEAARESGHLARYDPGVSCWRLDGAATALVVDVLPRFDEIVGGWEADPETLRRLFPSRRAT